MAVNFCNLPTCLVLDENYLILYPWYYFFLYVYAPHHHTTTAQSPSIRRVSVMDMKQAYLH